MIQQVVPLDFPNQMIQFYPNSSGCVGVSFCVTEDCTCHCSYCYQINKIKNLMTKETAKKIVDLLFELGNKDDPDMVINSNTIGLSIQFIGGEPLLNIETIDYICDYFLTQCIKNNPKWALHSRFNITTNGDLLFTDKVQDWLNKYKDFISITVTLDGPEEVHNMCRKHIDGSGQFENAYKAFSWINKNNFYKQSKITISPENLKDINKCLDFFINEGMNEIFGNVIYEHNWTIEEAKIFYKELKIMADKLLDTNPNISINLFVDHVGNPLPEDSLQCWCGGQGKMISFDPDGKAYPCLRYMTSSLGNDQPPIIIGDYNGIYATKEQKEIQKYLASINRRTKNTDECFYCPIASGCGDCAAWNYQETGDINSKSMNICNTHKARVIANAYFWNKYYLKYNITDKIFYLFLPKEECLKFIDEEEYNMIIDLIAQQDKHIAESE